MNKTNISVESFYELLQNIKEFTVDTTEMVDGASSNIPFGMLRVAKSIWDYRQKRKMEKFLKGIARNLNERGRYNHEDKKKLKKYLNNDHSKKRFFEILDSALNSISEICSEILGYYAGEILLKSQKLDYQSLVIIHALRNMNDWDIKHFNRAYNNLNSILEEEAKKGLNATALYLGLNIDEFKKESEKIEELIYKDEQLAEFKSALIKLNNLQVLNTGGMFLSSDANSFCRSKIGDKLNELINKYEYGKRVPGT